MELKCFTTTCKRIAQMPASEYCHDCAPGKAHWIYCDFCGELWSGWEITRHGRFNLCWDHLQEAIELESTPWPGPCPEQNQRITLLQEKLDLGLHELAGDDDND